jgi:hypothetical protein
MQYQLHIDIDLPRADVIGLFKNPDNMAKWQQGFISMRPIYGQAGQPGAQTRLYYKIGKREINMLETIREVNFPDKFVATYEADSVWNEARNRFIALSDSSTRWEAKHTFKFSTWMLRIMAFLIPSMFKKQSYKYMLDFKAFAEQTKL